MSTTRRGNPPGVRNASKLIVLMLLVALVLVATLVFRVHEHFGDLLEWIQRHNRTGPLVFICLYGMFAGDLLQ